MALALNVFQTVTSVVNTSPSIVYTAPVGYTGVLLLAQVANIGGDTEFITVYHRRGAVDTEMMYQYPISSNDTLSLFTGKLVITSGDKLVLFGSSSTNLKFVASILETLNQ
jgi:hypothetical protein